VKAVHILHVGHVAAIYVLHVMGKVRAGLVVYRVRGDTIEVFLVTPGAVLGPLERILSRGRGAAEA
jgi:hypothetical protein